jgi:hypothetical protein
MKIVSLVELENAERDTLDALKTSRLQGNSNSIALLGAAAAHVTPCCHAEAL